MAICVSAIWGYTPKDQDDLDVVDVVQQEKRIFQKYLFCFLSHWPKIHHNNTVTKLVTFHPISLIFNTPTRAHHSILADGWKEARYEGKWSGVSRSCESVIQYDVGCGPTFRYLLCTILAFSVIFSLSPTLLLKDDGCFSFQLAFIDWMFLFSICFHRLDAFLFNLFS